jgi:putative MATE family efflux protein
MKKRSDRTKALGTEPIGKLILRLGTPSVVSLGVLAFYNIVDAIFVGHGAGTLAIAGIGVAFPILLLIIGIGQLVGVGGASLLSRALGQKNRSLARKALGNTITLGLIVSAIIGVVGFLNRARLAAFAGATPEILPHALSYISVLVVGAFTLVLSSIFASTVRAQGQAARATFPIIAGGVLNVGLDPIFIFGLKLGVAGAAWATVISAGVTLSYYVVNMLRRRSGVLLGLRCFVLSASVTSRILGVGAASFVGVFASSVSTVVVNRALAAVGGDLPIAVFSVVNRIVMFSRMPIFGIVDGAQPIYGYNFGSGDYRRVIVAIRYAIATAMSLSGVFWGLFLLIPGGFLRVFSSDPLLLTEGARALRIIVIALPVLTLQAIVGGLYQALGFARRALAVSFLRDIVLMVPCVLVLSSIYGTTGVWAAFPVADFASAMIVLPFLILQIRRLRRMHRSALSVAG